MPITVLVCHKHRRGVPEPIVPSDDNCGDLCSGETELTILDEALSPLIEKDPFDMAALEEQGNVPDARDRVVPDLICRQDCPQSPPFLAPIGRRPVHPLTV